MSLKRWDEINKRFKKDQKLNMAEVGVDTGKTSARILRHYPKLILYMIDTWAPCPVDSSYHNSGSEGGKRGKEYYDKAYKKCRIISSEYNNRGILIRLDSVKAAEKFTDGFFDLVFIDADHSYLGCKRDILAYKSKVKKGGWLGGHDYDHPDQGEVKKAVDEIFGDKIILGENRTWWVKI